MTTPRLYRSPLWNGSVYERERHTTILRVFCFSLPPALLQTMAYRRAVLKSSILSQEEFKHYMNETVKRQDLLWDSNRQFHFIFHGAALFTAPAGREAQIAQLDRIERFIGTPHIKLGILPLESGMLPLDHGPFVLYDSRLMVTILTNYETESEDPREIAEGIKLFGDLERLACYGSEARLLVRGAIERFS